MTQLDKNYDPSVEMKWYELWEKNGYFRPEINPLGEPYCIVIPPPNVTGSLHMGHALNVTLQDILIRWKRMKGYKVLWLPGTDHAGIATQNVVEREIEKERIDRYTLGREKFIKRIWKWKQEYGERIITQLKRMGASCDWQRQRFTLDEGLSRAVKEVFVKLFESGLIYRELRLINWCPRCHTALSDLEVEYEEVNGKLTYIKYPLVNGDGYIVVATTRPETMLGDTAVAVHPEDSRYRDMVGKIVKLPLIDREIPIIADEEIDPNFGTGAVKVTPAHDFNDEAIAKRQNPPLPFITVIDEYGKMTDEAGKQYVGLDRYECRKKIVEDLKKLNLIEKEQKYKHSIGHCYRCKTPLEPHCTIQWYLNVRDIAEEAISVVKNKKVRIIPESWCNTYFAWMKNIRDWCISRQIWWGHQIPVWYCPYCKTDEGQIQGELIYITFYKPQLIGDKKIQGGTYTELRLRGIPAEQIIKYANTVRIDLSVKPICRKEEPKECPNCGNKELIRDPDVLDTWFSSALWPFSTLGWPEQTEDLKTFYPTSVLVTGFDILFFWVARMIMMGLKFMNDIPFRDVYIHALVRDSKGQKMSKSKGNVVDPLSMIDKYGADAFRFTLTAFAAQGRDIKFSEDRVEGYKNFINKLWNAARFILMNIEGEEKNIFNTSWKNELDITGRWILSKLNWTTQEIDKALKEYRFNDAAHSIYQFIWHAFCDWYIELTKPIIYSKDNTPLRKATQNCLVYVLDNSLRLLHPFMPFVTEEIWHCIFNTDKSIMLSIYPFYQERDYEAEEKMLKIIEAITGIRSIRGELNISPSTAFNVIIKPLNIDTKETLNLNKHYIKKLANVKELIIDMKAEKKKGMAISVRDNLEVYIPLEGLLDVAKEMKRLQKDLKKVEESISLLDKKLLNEEFIKKAPKEIVEKEKSRYNEFLQKKEKILESISRLEEVKKKE